VAQAVQRCDPVGRVEEIPHTVTTAIVAAGNRQTIGGFLVEKFLTVEPPKNC